MRKLTTQEILKIKNLPDIELVNLLQHIRNGNMKHPLATITCIHFFETVPNSENGFDKLAEMAFFSICVNGLKKMKRYINLEKYGIRSRTSYLDEAFDKFHEDY